MKCLISEFLAKEFRNLVAFRYVDQDVSISYEDSISRAEQIHYALKKMGVSKGDYVLLSAKYEHDWFASLVALASVGAIAVPVTNSITRYELSRIGRRIPIKYSLSDTEFIFRVHQSLVQTSELDGVLSLDVIEDEIPVPLLPHFKMLTEWGGKRDKLKVPKPHQKMTCHFTYKGFGIPLGVIHTYDDFCQSVASCQPIFNFKKGHRLLTLLPCYPVFGLVTNLLYPLAYGCELIIQDKKVSNILKAIENYKIDHVNLVPALAEKMNFEALKARREFDLSHICFVSGGSHLSEELYERFEHTFNVAPLQGYGLTETLPVLTNFPDDNVKGTLGKMMRPGVSVKILDRHGKDVPVGKAGEICIKGQGVITSYIGGENFREQLFRGEWLRTGDIGTVDEQGNIRFLGRRLPFTKILANMVDFREIENLVSEVTGVKSSKGYIVVDRGRKKIFLSLFVTRDFQSSKEDILDLCKERLSPYKVPSVVKIYQSSYRESM
ncbi:MAG: long-chain fatty acid--CoA ligase [Deltaproteobacteria bacterium]|nr:MAG: long-chain fatty acid--CoA ligase [Deltaproteobacteria bacterium]